MNVFNKGGVASYYPVPSAPEDTEKDVFAENYYKQLLSGDPGLAEHISIDDVLRETFYEYEKQAMMEREAQKNRGGLGSFFSGGFTDVLEGKAPFTQALQGIGAPEWFQDVNTTSNTIVNPMAQTGNALLGGRESGESQWDTWDKAVDVPKFWYEKGVTKDEGGRQGVVDYGLRKVGEELPKDVRKVAPVAGALIGNAIYPGAGAGAGYGVGAKLQGQENEPAMKGAMTAAVLSYIANAGSGGSSSATDGSGAGEMYNPAETGANTAGASTAKSISDALLKTVATSAARTGMSKLLPIEAPAMPESQGWANTYQPQYSASLDPEAGTMPDRMPTSLMRKLSGMATETPGALRAFNRMRV